MRTSPTTDTLGPLLLVVFQSILEVFLLCVAGYVLALKGILDKKTQKQLNRVNVSIFTPSLLFSKVAFFLSPAKLRELWIIPFFFLITTGVSALVAYVLGRLFRLKRSQRSFSMAAAMFMNSNSLPIALMQSLVLTVPGLKWGDDDDSDAMVGRALTYLVLHSTLGMVLRWSYGVRLLAQADIEPTPDVPAVEAGESGPLMERDETAFPISAEEQQIRTHSQPDPDGPEEIIVQNGRREWDSPGIDVRDPSNKRIRPTVFSHRKSTGIFHSFPNSPAVTPKRLPIPDSGAPSTVDLSLEQSDDDAEAYEDGDEFPAGMGRRHFTVPSNSRAESLWRRTRHRVRRFWAALNDFMTAPLWAALASLIVALIQPLQHTLEVHLPPVKNALNSAGQCSIPVTLIVLGAYFYTPEETDARLPGPRAANGEAGAPLSRSPSFASTIVGSVKGMLRLSSVKPERAGEQRAVGGAAKESHPGETKTVWVAVISRMVITPILLLPGMALSAYFDWHEIFEDPVFVVSNVLLISSPPALTLAQITQAASGDAFERLISRTIFWSYCVVTPPATILYVVVGLLLSKL